MSPDKARFSEKVDCRLGCTGDCWQGRDCSERQQSVSADTVTDAQFWAACVFALCLLAGLAVILAKGYAS